MSRKPSTADPARRNLVSVVALGCPKHQVDTENLLGALVERDVVLCPDPADASVVIVNTCGFIAPARTEGTEVVEEMIALKRRGRCRRLVVAGCWVVREEETLRERFPEVDVWLGLLTPARVAWLVDRVLADDAPVGAPPAGCEALAAETERVRVSPPHWAYLKIADGCDNRCAYCTIPDIRGPLRSKPPDAVLDETRRLADEGVLEVDLVAQDTTAWGHDLDGKPGLADLLRRMVRVDGIRWIRLLYTHPAHFTDELVDLIAGEPKVCEYVDLPIQHIVDRVLEAMGRRVTRARIESLIARLRDAVPDVTLRTTVLVGFPGETEAEFAELCAFLESTRFERLGCFAWSPEAGTPAASLAGRVPEAERLRRADAVMTLQRTIAFEIAESRVGRELPVIVDAFAGEGDGDGLVEEGDRHLFPHEAAEKRASPLPHDIFIGRTRADAPDVDPVVFLAGNTAPGRIERARITAARGYDLVGIV